MLKSSSVKRRTSRHRGESSTIVRKPALVLVRPDLPRPTVALPALRRPSRRTALLAGGAVAAVALAYLLARVTPLFAVRAVDVSGAPPLVAADVRAALEPLDGKSLVAVDATRVARRLELLPSVRSASVDRAFPHALRIVIVPEQPLAVVHAGGSSWLVSIQGRVIRRVEPKPGGSLPAVWLGGKHRLGAGATVVDPRTRLALAALAALPERFPLEVRVARVRDGALALVTRSGVEIRLGDGSVLALKTAVAATILARLSPSDLGGVGYLDVSVPDRPVSGLNSQVAG